MGALRLPQFNRSRTKPTLWGDGFESDSFRSIAAVSDWDSVASDEFLRLYPRLANTSSNKLSSHLERCLATLVTQAVGQGSVSLRSIADGRIVELASLHTPNWSPAPTRSYLRRLDLADLSGLDRLIMGLRADDRPFFDVTNAESLVFHTGVHPAYLWSEALASHQWFTTLGWLGIVMRGRPALMPIDVAEYLAEALDSGNAGHRGLEAVLTTPRERATLVRLAKMRLKGRRIVAERLERRDPFSWLARSA